MSAVTGGAMSMFAIHFAAQKGNLECLKYLLKNKAQVNVQGAWCQLQIVCGVL